MNRFFKTILPLLLCVSMLLPVFSAFAETSEKPDPTDLDKMREFFSQLTDEDNVTNGTRVLSIVYGEHTEYDPTDYSQLPLMKNIEWSDGLINEFNSTVHLDPCTWPVVDLFGTLDLSETNTYSINISSPVHISALYANNCTNLYRLAYISRNDISVIEATGGIPLSSCRIKTPVRTARLDIENYTSTFGFNMLGHGVISMNCDGDYISFLKVNGYTAEYYSNGVLLDKNYGGGINIYPDDGIYDVTVIFGGDADGDGTLTLGDALAIMRTAMGVAPEFGDNIGDMNANGEINLDDAITLARICIGAY